MEARPALPLLKELAKEPDKARAILSEWLLGAKVVQRKEGVFLQVEIDPERLLGIENRGGSGGSLRQLSQCRYQSPV